MTQPVRERIIVELLERYAELTDPMQAGNGGTTSGLTMMPHAPGCHVRDWNPPTCTCYRRSVVELERLLRQMRDHGGEILTIPIPHSHGQSMRVSVRSLWWHLNARYIASTKVQREIMVRRRGKHGKTALVPEQRIITLKNPSNDTLVASGVTWLAEHWDRDVFVQMPVDTKGTG
jgi:hypothetical protein